MAAPITKNVITLAELQASPEFLACTPKMQTWLTTLIENQFDYIRATAAAFDCKNAQVFSYAVRSWPRIRAALNLYFGRSEQDQFLEDLAQTIRRAPKGSDRRVRAMALYARMKFGVNENAEPEAATENETIDPVVIHKFRVGEIATLEGRQFRVTAVNDDGTVSEAEPL
jgi:hypothetical protein